MCPVANILSELSCCFQKFDRNSLCNVYIIVMFISKLYPNFGLIMYYLSTITLWSQIKSGVGQEGAMAASTTILHEGNALILCECSQGYDSTHCHVSIHCWELISQWRVMAACPGHRSLAL
jgi:hypothetical protein